MMNEASVVAGIPPGKLRSLYAKYSESVHTNPVTVIGGSSEGERVRSASASGAISTVLAIYGRPGSKSLVGAVFRARTVP